MRRLVRTRIGPLRDRRSRPAAWRELTARRGAGAVRRGAVRSRPRTAPELTSSPVRVLALRGAITCDEDTKAEIDDQDQAARAGDARPQRRSPTTISISIIFTATDDITAEFPATAARALGLGDVPLLCARELGIVHGMPLCIRVLDALLQRAAPATTLHHVYLEGARSLRDDLPE